MCLLGKHLQYQNEVPKFCRSRENFLVSCTLPNMRSVSGQQIKTSSTHAHHKKLFAADIFQTYNLFLGVGSATVRSSERGRALLQVPRLTPLLRDAADWQRVYAVCVTITITAVPLIAPVPWGPHKHWTLSISALEILEMVKTTSTLSCILRPLPRSQCILLWWWQIAPLIDQEHAETKLASLIWDLFVR